jgi:hypothetical protein
LNPSWRTAKAHDVQCHGPEEVMNNDIQNSNPVAHILIVGGNSLFHCDSSNSPSSSGFFELECPSFSSDFKPCLSFDAISSYVDLADFTDDRVLKCKMRSTEQIVMHEAALPKMITVSPGLENRLITMDQRLERIETMVASILNKQKVQEWYTTEEFAGLVGKAEFTVREWCRNGRIHAKKAQSGRGPNKSWVISHDEWIRYQRDNLLPDKKS